MDYEDKARKRFLDKIQVVGDCWIWTGAKVAPMRKIYPDRFYGRFRLRDEVIYAHRASYILFVGDIPEGLSIDHLCRVTLCVRPSHLEAVTQAENLRRAPKHVVHGDERGRGRHKDGV